MTALVEDAFASLTASRVGRHVLRIAPRTAPAAREVPPATPVPSAGTTTGSASSPPPALGQRPRARLLAAAPTATTPRAQGAAIGVPPTLGERVRVLRAGDRKLVVGADDEDRSAVPVTDPRLVVRQLATAGVEVLTGLRPASQLARWLAPGVLEALRVRSTLGGRTPRDACRAAACRTVRVVRVDRRAVEATAVVDDGRRVRAVALRLEAHRGVWRATALEIG